MDNPLSLFLVLSIGLILTLLVLWEPYLGLAFTIASQPIVEMLPVIPMLSSVVPVIGLVTVLSFLLRASRENVKGALVFSSNHVLALLFIIWILVSNPAAAWSGPDRNWIFTFLQLFILFWLSGFLVNTLRKQQILMWIFSATTLLSVFFVIQSGGFFEEIDPVVRAAGLTEGANTAARYSVVAFVFLNYLRTVERNPILRFVALLGTIVTFFGVFYTVSRTGMILLGTAVVLLILLQTKVKFRFQILVTVAAAFIILISFSSSILSFIQEIAPSITHGTDTMGLRYALWEAGWEMWLDHPVNGVGIGMFPHVLRLYPNATYPIIFARGLVAHNIYVSVLAETGIIGILLFIAFLVAALSAILRARKHLDPAFRSLANSWLIVLVVMLIGGLTKTDQTDKVLWLVLGICWFFSYRVKSELRSSTAEALVTQNQNIVSRAKAIID